MEEEGLCKVHGSVVPCTTFVADYIWKPQGSILTQTGRLPLFIQLSPVLGASGWHSPSLDLLEPPVSPHCSFFYRQPEQYKSDSKSLSNPNLLVSHLFPP